MFSDYLAKTYMNKKAEDAVSGSAVLDDLKEKRRAFESSLREEEVLRNYAKRMRGIAADRAKDSPQGVGASLDVLRERMAPIPHSVGEAVTRLPLIGLGAGLGYRWGAERSAVGAEELQRLALNPDKELRKQVLEQVKAQAKGKGTQTGALLKAIQKDPESAAAALRSMPFAEPKPAVEALAAKINRTMGLDGVSKLRKTLGAAVGIMDKDKPALGLVGKLFKNKYTAIPALLGAGAASIGTGLAYGVPDAIDQFKGGRGAVAAREAATGAETKAKELAALRESLIKKLERLNDKGV